MQKRQDISDIFGKYTEVNGEGALYVNFRQKKDDSYDFSVWRREVDHPLSSSRSCHIVNGKWDNGLFKAFNIMELGSNECQSQPSVLKEIIMGTEYYKNCLTLIVAEYRILDYSEMNRSHTSLSDWRKSAPNDQTNLIHYTKMYFKKDGRVEFYLKNPDHSVIESKIYRREDRLLRPNHGTIKAEVTNSLFSGYAEGLELAEFREDDASDQYLNDAAVRAELVLDQNIGLLPQETVSSEDGGSEQQGDVVTWAGIVGGEEENVVVKEAVDEQVYFKSLEIEAMEDKAEAHLQEIIKSTRASLELLASDPGGGGEASDPGGGGEDEFRDMIDDGSRLLEFFEDCVASNTSSASVLNMTLYGTDLNIEEASELFIHGVMFKLESSSASESRQSQINSSLAVLRHEVKRLKEAASQIQKLPEHMQIQVGTNDDNSQDDVTPKVVKTFVKRIFVKSLISEETNYSCVKCPAKKPYTNFKSYQRHVQSKHPEDGKISAEDLEKKDRYECLLPSRKFPGRLCLHKVQKNDICRHLTVVHQEDTPKKRTFKGFFSTDERKTFFPAWGIKNETFPEEELVEIVSGESNRVGDEEADQNRLPATDVSAQGGDHPENVQQLLDNDGTSFQEDPVIEDNSHQNRLEKTRATGDVHTGRQEESDVGAGDAEHLPCLLRPSDQMSEISSVILPKEAGDVGCKEPPEEGESGEHTEHFQTGEGSVTVSCDSGMSSSNLEECSSEFLSFVDSTENLENGEDIIYDKEENIIDVNNELHPTDCDSDVSASNLQKRECCEAGNIQLLSVSHDSKVSAYNLQEKEEGSGTESTEPGQSNQSCPTGPTLKSEVENETGLGRLDSELKNPDRFIEIEHNLLATCNPFDVAGRVSPIDADKSAVSDQSSSLLDSERKVTTEPLSKYVEVSISKDVPLSSTIDDQSSDDNFDVFEEPDLVETIEPTDELASSLEYPFLNESPQDNEGREVNHKEKRYERRNKLEPIIKPCEMDENLRFIESFKKWLVEKNLSNPDPKVSTISFKMGHLFEYNDSWLNYFSRQDPNFNLMKLILFQSENFMSLPSPSDWINAIGGPSLQDFPDRRNECAKAFKRLIDFILFKLSQETFSGKTLSKKRDIRDHLSDLEESINKMNYHFHMKNLAADQRDKKKEMLDIVNPTNEENEYLAVTTWFNSKECQNLQEEAEKIYHKATERGKNNKNDFRRYSNIAYLETALSDKLRKGSYDALTNRDWTLKKAVYLPAGFSDSSYENLPKGWKIYQKPKLDPKAVPTRYEIRIPASRKGMKKQAQTITINLRVHEFLSRYQELKRLEFGQNLDLKSPFFVNIEGGKMADLRNYEGSLLNLVGKVANVQNFTLKTTRKALDAKIQQDENLKPFIKELNSHSLSIGKKHYDNMSFARRSVLSNSLNKAEGSDLKRPLEVPEELKSKRLKTDEEEKDLVLQDAQEYLDEAKKKRKPNFSPGALTAEDLSLLKSLFGDKTSGSNKVFKNSFYGRVDSDDQDNDSNRLINIEETIFRRQRGDILKSLRDSVWTGSDRQNKIADQKISLYVKRVLDGGTE